MKGNKYIPWNSISRIYPRSLQAFQRIGPLTGHTFWHIITESQMCSVSQFCCGIERLLKRNNAAVRAHLAGEIGPTDWFSPVVPKLYS